MKIVNPQRFNTLVKEAQESGFSGWDFNWLSGRMLQENPPWDYPSLVKAYFEDVHSLLDLGTGGGELLASLAPLPLDTHATEAYPPNQILALERLSDLGVKVHPINEGASLPFSSERFDLIICRHEGFDPQEIERLLKPDGTFITQQVGGLDNLELNQVLEEKISFPYLGWGLAAALTDLYQAGFIIERAEKAALKSSFLDIGAVVYYLKAIPWQIKDFSPETHFDPLVRLHNIIEHQGQFIATAHRFLIIARKRAKY